MYLEFAHDVPMQMHCELRDCLCHLITANRLIFVRVAFHAPPGEVRMYKILCDCATARLYYVYDCTVADANAGFAPKRGA